MPRQPRNLSPSKIEPSYSTTDKPPTPYMGSGEGEKDPKDREREAIKLTKRISMFDYKVDPVDVLAKLLPGKYETDDYTGMVSRT